jgi:hypothetical protein
VNWVFGRGSREQSMRNSVLIAVGLQAGAVGLGYLWGVAFDYPVRSSSVYTTSALIAGLLMLSGVFTSLVSVPLERARHRRAACIASLLYSVGVVLCEPFWRVHQIDEIVVAALVQVPLLLAIGYLVCCQAWGSVAGVVLFVFTSNVMIASNANSSASGSGFFRSWVS